MPSSRSRGQTSNSSAVTGSGEPTRERIVAAATEEFARHGIAGARVDRIAKLARTSKERVYVYFRSKEALYVHIAEREMTIIADATQMDPTDLPHYAGVLFDYFSAHPDHHRLVTWGRLELADIPATEANPIWAALTRKIDQLRQAQQAGQLDPAWDPVDILALVNQIATTWAAQPEFSEPVADQATDPTTAARRAAVVAAVGRLFPRMP